MSNEFFITLKTIKESPEQQSYQKQERSNRYLEVIYILLFGLFAAISAASLISSQDVYISTFFIIASVSFFILWERCHVHAINLSKEQDRKYFLECLRASKDVDDLNNSGFFAHFSTTHGPEWLADVEESIENMGRAIKIKPEWLINNEYS